MNCSEDEDVKEMNNRLKSVSMTSLVKKELLRTPEKFIKERSSFESPFHFSPFVFDYSPDNIQEKGHSSKTKIGKK